MVTVVRIHPAPAYNIAKGKVMTVGELIEHLQNYDKDTKVFVSAVVEYKDVDSQYRQHQELLEVGGGKYGLDVCLLAGF